MCESGREAGSICVRGLRTHAPIINIASKLTGWNGIKTIRILVDIEVLESQPS